MNQLIRLTILFFACAALAVIVGAGPEPLSTGKEMKQVAPAPLPECNWSGFYIGLNAGGQFGHSETGEPDTFNSPAKLKWGYSESGFVGGGQFGYNFQWHWLVIGPEFDLGYLSLDGHGREPPVGTLTDGETDGDFYTTLRGRAGVALNCWLFYATGGGIGVNYTSRLVFDDAVFAERTDFNWGYTVGGGIERMLNPHWSIKAEYLYYAIGEQNFSGTNAAGTFGFSAETQGHIVRAGLNYKF